MRIFPLVAAAVAATLAMPAAMASASAAPLAAAAYGHARAGWSDRPHWRTICKTQWRHHHRERVCHRERSWH